MFSFIYFFWGGAGSNPKVAEKLIFRNWPSRIIEMFGSLNCGKEFVLVKNNKAEICNWAKVASGSGKKTDVLPVEKKKIKMGKPMWPECSGFNLGAVW